MVKTRKDFEPDTSKTRADFEPDLGLMREQLEQVKNTLQLHFEIKDWQGVEIVMAIAAAHYVPGEMLWLRFIGPSRSGRTELLRAIAEHKDCTEMEVVTPAAFRGGLKAGPKILDRIDGKLVITKDIAAMLSARSEVKSELFGVLRNIKDGKIISDFGSDEGNLKQDASYDWILAATTEAIEQMRRLDFLGQRFIDLRWQPGDREAMAYKAAKNSGTMKNIRDILSTAVKSFLFVASQEPELLDFSLDDSELRWLANIANTTALLRTPINRDRQGLIRSFPEPEVGTDLAQSFTRIVRVLKALSFDDWTPYISRISWDCAPQFRAMLLKCLGSGPKSISELEKATGIPQRSIYYHIEELVMLKVVTDKGGQISLNIKLP